MLKQPQSTISSRPRLTVAAVVEQDGRFLMVEERSDDGRMVLNQPAGHVEPGESLLDAVVRETLEESAWRFRPEYIVGVYLWQRNSRSSFLRFCFSGSVDNFEPDRPLDDGIERALWLSRDDLIGRLQQMRSPMVLQNIDDYLSGERYSLSMLKSLLA